MNSSLRVLHTSDWHLGRRLYGHTRYAEFSAFLDWLYQCIIDHKVDVLIVAGDVFDTMTPSNKAQSLYYEFLGRISHSPCQHVIIVAGNHDSPSLLDAPKNVLKFLNVHIIGTACNNIADEVITLTNSRNHHNRHNEKLEEAQAIIVAVPYLRDKDVRHSASGESISDKDSQLIAGIKSHYTTATDIARQRQQQIVEQQGRRVPIIATGHLFATGGQTTSDDGVRDLYVGSLGKIGVDVFADDIDYVALGHLHVPQLVGKQSHIRYSGSPIAMGFGEAMQQKQVVLVEFKHQREQAITDDIKKSTSSIESLSPVTFSSTIETIAIPRFHQLVRIKGNLDTITNQLTKLIESTNSDKSDEQSEQENPWKNPVIPVIENQVIWVEVIYEDSKTSDPSNQLKTYNLNEYLHQMVADTQVVIIKIKNTQTYQNVLHQSEQAESLHDLSHTEIFERRLDMKGMESQSIDTDTRTQLLACYQQIIYDIQHEDKMAE